MILLLRSSSVSVFAASRSGLTGAAAGLVLSPAARACPGGAAWGGGSSAGLMAAALPAVPVSPARPPACSGPPPLPCPSVALPSIPAGGGTLQTWQQLHWGAQQHGPTQRQHQ